MPHRVAGHPRRLCYLAHGGLHLHKFLTRPSAGVTEVQQDLRLTPMADEPGDDPVRTLAECTGLVQFVHVLVQRSPLLGESACLCLPVLAGPGSSNDEGLAQLCAKGLFRCLIRVKLQAEGSEPDIREALMHHI